MRDKEELAVCTNFQVFCSGEHDNVLSELHQLCCVLGVFFCIDSECMWTGRHCLTWTPCGDFWTRVAWVFLLSSNHLKWPTAVQRMDVEKPTRTMLQCSGSPKTLLSFASGKSRSKRLDASGLPKASLSCALSISARTVLSPDQPQWPKPSGSGASS